MAERQEGTKLIISIVERGQGKNLTKIYSQNNVSFHYKSYGIGTASSELLDVIGFGSTERDILFSVATTANANMLMNKLNNELDSSIDAKGIAVDLSITAMNAMVAAVLMRQGQVEQQNGGIKMEQEGNNSLIVVIINRGCTDDVMNTARAAGARGGTIIRARGTGAEHIEAFYGITFQAEKEIVFIVASGEKRNAIMETVNKKHGLNTEAAAMLFSLGIDQIQRLG
ncbi:hypothetical protein LQZ18_15700 [Lachnospiraceae bacterium ZAX-1]